MAAARQGLTDLLEQERQKWPEPARDYFWDMVRSIADREDPEPKPEGDEEEVDEE
jgi:hypothetical protein